MARGLDAGKYFWRSGREKCFSLDIPFNRTSGQRLIGSSRGDADSEAVPCPPVLKITQGVLIGLENFLLYLILQTLTRNAF